MIEPVWIIGFVGHRPKDALGRTNPEMNQLGPTIRKVLGDLAGRARARGGRAELLCGVAAGADLIAAREAESLGMAVHVILPMPESSFEADFQAASNDGTEAQWKEDWKEAQRFIRLAQGGAGGATFRLVRTSQLRDECYYEQGAQIVEASDAIVSLWDGIDAQPANEGADSEEGNSGRGGTADIVALARADKMPFHRETDPRRGYVWRSTPCIVINSQTGDVTGNFEDFASATDAGYAEMHSVARAAKLKFDRKELPSAPGELLKLLDRDASDWGAKLRHALLGAAGFHFAASLVAAVAAAAYVLLLNWIPAQLAALELALVSLALSLVIWSHFKHAQARWLELRLATELLRGLVGAKRLLDPLFPLTTAHLPGWRRFCMSAGLEVWREANSVKTMAEEKDRYLEERIRHQRDHYRAYDPHHRHRWHRAAEYAGPVASFLALGVVIAALIHKIQHGPVTAEDHVIPPPLGTILVYRFLPIALPLIAGAAASLMAITDSKRRAQMYPELAERLEGAMEMLPALRTEPALREFVRRIEEVLLDELVSWYAAAKGISH